MKLYKVLLFATAGIVVYKALNRVKVVKADFPKELELATEIMREVYGTEFAKDFKKAIQDNERKTSIKIDGEEIAMGIKLFKRPTVMDVQDATDKAKEMIDEYKGNFKEISG